MGSRDEGITFTIGESRAISYYLEYLIIMGLFGKTTLSIGLFGITNDEIDPSVDSMIHAIPKILTTFNNDIICKIKVNKRGFRPNGNILSIILSRWRSSLC